MPRGDDLEWHGQQFISRSLDVKDRGRSGSPGRAQGREASKVLKVIRGSEMSGKQFNNDRAVIDVFY